jgi:hypothetical protein
MDGTGSRLCQISGFGISGDKTSDFIVKAAGK